MNAMGHSVKTYIGVDKKDLAKRIAKIAPGYMPMGSNGMGEMGSMEMPLPDNTLPMMTGFAQFGPVEMGGMFSVVKVREGLAKTDYKDPGPYKIPRGRLRSNTRARGSPRPRARRRLTAASSPSIGASRIRASPGSGRTASRCRRQEPAFQSLTPIKHSGEDA